MTHVCINIHHLEDDLYDMMESGLFLVNAKSPPKCSIIREVIRDTFAFRINPLFRL